jgi:hypothetical protein
LTQSLIYIQDEKMEEEPTGPIVALGEFSLEKVLWRKMPIYLDC